MTTALKCKIQVHTRPRAKPYTTNENLLRFNIFDNFYKFFFYWRTIHIFVSLGYAGRHLSIYELRPINSGTLKAMPEQGSGCILDPNFSPCEELTSSGGIHFSLELLHKALNRQGQLWKSRHIGTETVFWTTVGE